MAFLIIAAIIFGGAILALKLLAGVVRFVFGGLGIVIAIGLIIYWASSDHDTGSVSTPTAVSTPAT